MEFTTDNLGVLLLTQLKTATKAIAAVAFFNPDETVLSAMKKVPKLRLLVADDFLFNNLHKLESLCQRGNWVRAAQPEADSDTPHFKLHSKVFLIVRRDGSRWAMVGSANLTRPGLYSNQEACVVFDSRRREDGSIINEIAKWLDKICDDGHSEIDFEVAKAVYETRAKYKIVPSSADTATKDSMPNGHGFWALKPGWNGKHWQKFKAENVIGFGWNEIKGNPSAMSTEQIAKAYRSAWPGVSDRGVNKDVAQITKFTQQMGDGDVVLICGRYDATNTKKDAYIYGVARTESKNGSSFFDDKKSSWFRFKRHAIIQPIEVFVPRNMIARALGKGSLAQTIHALDQEGFERLAKLLCKEFGIAINL